MVLEYISTDFRRRLVYCVSLTLFVLLFSGCSARYKTETIKVTARPVPWTHIPLRNDPADFQFAIVADRTGGHRPGVFSSALDKLNLLQPEFVMCVGDLIEGGIEDTPEIRRQHDEFDRMVRDRRIPFFRIPGNHDISNPVMADLWRKEIGRPYYHFVYQDVLFLCLNSEDPPQADKTARLSPDQIAYFSRVLKKCDDVRWTLIFVHKPMWESPGNKGWIEFENLLGDRPCTVFAGHQHTYSKTIRNGRTCYKLATTGGSSNLAGISHGKFDHVCWVTMTDDGPLIANLLLDGIRDDDPRDDAAPAAGADTTAPSTGY